MRMWNVKPGKMCDRHLLGEHVECHMFVGTLNRNKKIQGYIDKGLVEVHNIKKRHDELAGEMLKRGMKHKSPLPEYKMKKAGRINPEKNIIELKKRCSKCREIK